MRFIHDFFRNYEFELSENPRDALLYIGLSDGCNQTLILGKDMDVIRGAMLSSCLINEDFKDVLISVANTVTLLNDEGIYTLEDYANKRMKNYEND